MENRILDAYRPIVGNEAIVELNNQTNTESSSSPLIVEIRVNFDIHNDTGDERQLNLLAGDD